tara:strand:- start:2142 stop:6695 length:4554 start_codon:yes stop_codon:yes gene_type:complete
MADENNNQNKIFNLVEKKALAEANGQGSNTQAGSRTEDNIGGIDNDTTPRPRPCPPGFTYDPELEQCIEDTPEEDFDPGFEPVELPPGYQSEIFFANGFTVTPAEFDSDPFEAKIKFQALGFPNNDWDSNGLETIGRLVYLTSRYPGSTANPQGELMRMALQRHSFYDRENEFLEEVEPISDSQIEYEYIFANGSLTPPAWMSLPFPSDWSEFDGFNGDKTFREILEEDDTGAAARNYLGELIFFWGGDYGDGYDQNTYNGVGRADIAFFLAVFQIVHVDEIISIEEGINYLAGWPYNFEGGDNHQYNPETIALLESGVFPDGDNQSQSSETFYNYLNLYVNFTIEIDGPYFPFDWGAEPGESIYYDDQVRFRLVGHEVQWSDVDFGFPPFEYDILIDSSEGETISSNFGLQDIVVEQTISQSTDAYSAIEIPFVQTYNFKNTSKNFLQSDLDKRIALGCFVFDDDNPKSDNFPNILKDNFKSFQKENLVPNGDGKNIKSLWKNNGETGRPRERIFIPEGGWGYCTYDGIAPETIRRTGSLYRGGDGNADNDLWGIPISWNPDADPHPMPDGGGNGVVLIGSFPQSEDYYNYPFQEGIDNQDVSGSAGFCAYFFDYRIGRTSSNSLLRLQHNLITSSALTQYPADICNKFLMQCQIDSVGKGIGDSAMDNVGTTQMESVSTHVSGITPIKGFGIGRSSPTGSAGTYDFNEEVYLPNMAKWVLTNEAFSYNRCLEFLSTNINNGQHDVNDSGNNNYTYDFDWNNYFSMNVAEGGFYGNQYRSLNQVIRLYNPYRDTVINPFTVMEVKFKMKTSDLFYYEDKPPEIEIAVVDGDFSTMAPDRIDDRIDPGQWPEHRNLPYAASHGYWPHGDFNSQRYNAEDNTEDTLDKKYSNFGSMGRFTNSVLNEWEEFSYTFTLGDIFRYNTGIIRPLYLIVQATDEFYGRVLLDNFEVYESHDFTPDCDVRKKISVGNYGKADLTKYYDKELQPEEYKDSQAPLEAQFYFYPTYKTDRVFNVKRTPTYQDFKKGLFYIFNVNWGDGSPNEFTSEPEPIDEETALYHTYETNGIFEVTGTMIKTKKDLNGDELGIIKNKKFRLVINVNEGLDEDFKYFGNYGFSFIPFKNTLPVIGGFSKQSIYYKALRRQLGIIDDDTITNTSFKYNGDKLKTQLALAKMDSSFNDEFDMLNDYTKTYYTEAGDLIYTGKQFSSTYEQLGKSIGDCDITSVKYYSEPKSIWELFGFPEGSYENSIADYNVDEEHLAELPFPTNFSEFDLSEDGIINQLDISNYGFHYGRPDIAMFITAYILAAVGDLTQESVYEFFETLQQQYESSYIIPQDITIPFEDVGEIQPFESFRNPEGGVSTTGVAIPQSPRYWKNIIPADYSIFNREGLDGDLVDTYSEQEWLDDYYYPVLPKYGQNGRFIQPELNEYGTIPPGTYPNDKKPFPLEGPITDENEINKNLIINISSEKIGDNALNDYSGNNNLGFSFSDFKTNFDDKTIKPKKTKNMESIKTSTNNGAF